MVVSHVVLPKTYFDHIFLPNLTIILPQLTKAEAEQKPELLPIPKFLSRLPAAFGFGPDPSLLVKALRSTVAFWPCGGTTIRAV